MTALLKLKPADGSKAAWQRSAVPVTALLAFLAANDAPWWGLAIAGVVLTIAEQWLRPSTASKNLLGSGS